MNLELVSACFTLHDKAMVIYQVSPNVNQYVIRHATKTTLSGSQIPLEASSAALKLEARSIGTRRMMLTGRARARKIGTSR